MLSDLHFAPTKVSRANLIREGVQPDSIHVTGNTVIDALYMAVEKINANPPLIPELPAELMANGQPLVLITGHRRENFGKGFQNICAALASFHPETPGFWSVAPSFR
ncbi:UDP-N-acetylglucosamine 2-epimerase [Desulfoferrobacter suflitae]|uniref:UDP-N-acetylglucosamine 2-epimerase n=1 Tax=Desulfoferrobacter suflitae TaxID=2865782 RepID=UPI00338DF528